MSPLFALKELVDLGWNVSLHRLDDRAGAFGAPIDPAHPKVYRISIWRSDASGTRSVHGYGRHGVLLDSARQALGDAQSCARKQELVGIASELEALVAKLDAPPVAGVCECYRPQNLGHESHCPHWSEADGS